MVGQSIVHIVEYPRHEGQRSCMQSRGLVNRYQGCHTTGLFYWVTSNALQRHCGENQVIKSFFSNEDSAPIVRLPQERIADLHHRTKCALSDTLRGIYCLTRERSVKYYYQFSEMRSLRARKWHGRAEALSRRLCPTP